MQEHFSTSWIFLCVVKMTECAKDVCRQGVSVCMQQDLFRRHLSRSAGQFLSISTVSRYIHLVFQ